SRTAARVLFMPRSLPCANNATGVRRRTCEEPGTSSGLLCARRAPRSGGFGDDPRLAAGLAPLQHVSEAADVDDVARLGGVVFYLAADPPDVDLHDLLRLA